MLNNTDSGEEYGSDDSNDALNSAARTKQFRPSEQNRLTAMMISTGFAMYSAERLTSMVSVISIERMLSMAAALAGTVSSARPLDFPTALCQGKDSD